MAGKKTQYSIREYQSFTTRKGDLGPSYECMDENTFNALEDFILANHSLEDTEPIELMVLSSRRGLGKIISARNYVGLITMKDGTEIEILPKIHSSEDKDTRKIFLEMLKTVKDVPYKKFNVGNLNTERMNIFEAFIRMFIDEAYRLVRKGLKSSYVLVSGNESFFKGKMLTAQHIKNNCVHKERVFVEYDLFSTNRAENKLVKSTVRYLWKTTSNAENKKDLNILLAHLEAINYSTNYRSDFSQCIKNRNMSDYDSIIKWCRVFLFNESFSNFAGSEVAYALLFPMEYVFESYVANLIRKSLSSKDYIIKVQDSRFYLFDNPRKFALRPDIVIEDRQTGEITVLDTKWKLLSKDKPSYGISQADMYQMYAYQKKYGANRVVLIYPFNEKVADCEEGFMFRAEDNIEICGQFLKLGREVKKFNPLQRMVAQKYENQLNAECV